MERSYPANQGAQRLLAEPIEARRVAAREGGKVIANNQEITFVLNNLSTP